MPFALAPQVYLHVHSPWLQLDLRESLHTCASGLSPSTLHGPLSSNDTGLTPKRCSFTATTPTLASKSSELLFCEARAPESHPHNVPFPLRVYVCMLLLPAAKITDKWSRIALEVVSTATRLEVMLIPLPPSNTTTLFWPGPLTSTGYPGVYTGTAGKDPPLLLHSSL